VLAAVSIAASLEIFTGSTRRVSRNALYLLMPDTYVALADASGAPDAVDRYSAERGLRLASPNARLS
jgi:hypothetical protein